MNLLIRKFSLISIVLVSMLLNSCNQPEPKNWLDIKVTLSEDNTDITKLITLDVTANNKYLPADPSTGLYDLSKIKQWPAELNITEIGENNFNFNQKLKLEQKQNQLNLIANLAVIDFTATSKETIANAKLKVATNLGGVSEVFSFPIDKNGKVYTLFKPGKYSFKVERNGLDFSNQILELPKGKVTQVDQPVDFADVKLNLVLQPTQDHDSNLQARVHIKPKKGQTIDGPKQFGRQEVKLSFVEYKSIVPGEYQLSVDILQQLTGTTAKTATEKRNLVNFREIPIKLLPGQQTKDIVLKVHAIQFDSSVFKDAEFIELRGSYPANPAAIWYGPKTTVQQNVLRLLKPEDTNIFAFLLNKKGKVLSIESIQKSELDLGNVLAVRFKKTSQTNCSQFYSASACKDFN